MTEKQKAEVLSSITPITKAITGYTSESSNTYGMKNSLEEQGRKNF